MSCMDIFVMPSFEELNPISLKEALSWNMKCFVSKLLTIENSYKNDPNLTFINNNNFYDYLRSKVFENELSEKKLNKEYHFEKDSNDIFISFIPNPRVEILGSEKYKYNIKFIDANTNIVHYECDINTNMWTACSIQYFCKWKIIVTNTKLNIEKIYTLNLENQSVKIINESSSLGDTLAWMGAIDKFQKLHNCNVDYYTCKKELFESEYPNINFYDYNHTSDKKYYSQYKIGCFDFHKDADLAKVDWRVSNLQKIAFEILGLNYIETKSKINIPNKFKLKYSNYVCIATQSTSQSRYWNNKNGWEKVIEYLKQKGYKIVCVDKNYSFGNSQYMNNCPKGVDYFAGQHNFDEIIDIINKSEFFIGLSSGLSWLAWVLDKKIIKINGSVDSSFEFFTPFVVENKNLCNGCFNNVNYKFDPANWCWCPENKNFECTSMIKDSDVITQIDKLINNINIKINKKIKLLHLQTTRNLDSEKKSKQFIEKFSQFGIEYINYKNKIYSGNEHLNNCLYPDLLTTNGEDKLSLGHYGCYSSTKKGILEQFSNDVDYLLICEGDCLFETTHDLFVDLLNKITNICDKNNIEYFSFGDKYTLENKVLQSEIIEIPENQNLCFITQKIIGTQCIMFSKSIREKLINNLNTKPWYITDGWFNDFCYRNKIKQGILFNRIASQYSGVSSIDNKYKNFNNI